jgi:transcriptional regulator with AAA-type ATPase domain
VGREPLHIGSAGANDVVLPVRGVSRRHAVLSADETGLTLEDLGSKNGVLVNGVRVQRTLVKVGDEIRLGPVTLHLDEVAAGDSELAIAVEAEPESVVEVPTGHTTSVHGLDVGGRAGPWLALVDGLLARLCLPPEGDLPGALGLVVTGLLADGGCIVEWTGPSTPSVLWARGRIPEVSLDERARCLLERARGQDQPGACRAAFADGDPALSAAALSGPGDDGLGIVLWGDFPGRRESAPLLTALLRLVGRFRPRPIHAPRGQAASGLPPLVFPEGYVVGAAPSMVSLYGQMRPLLLGDLPVLIVGETGVGKEHLARILHASSDRRDGPFVPVNCAAIPADLLEAEMFGIRKGVATGVTEREGKFQLASGGTLFLDEIGDMSPGLQAKLLRALQEREVQPVGGAPIPVDIRVLTATNTDLHGRMERGEFRRDLYYRVAGYVLRVPPLRDRREDVPALTEAFLRRFSGEIGRSIRGITVKALRTLIDYPWPGNVRELEHEVRRLVYLCPDGEAIDSVMLSESLRPGPGEALPSQPEPGDASLELEAHVAKMEDRLIRQALAQAGGNRSQAAKLLGISRNGLAIKMERLGIA